MFFSSIVAGVLLASLVEGQCFGTTTITSQAQATGLANCPTFDGDVVIDSDATGDISLDGVSMITGDLRCGYFVDIVSLRADDLVTIGSVLSITSIDLLTSLHFPSLKNIDSLYLSSLPNLTEFGSTSGITNVTSITIRRTGFSNLNWLKPKYIGSLEVEGNPALSDISLPIVNTSSYVSIEANGHDLQISLPKLQVGYNLSVENAKGIDLSSLAYVNNSLGFVANTFKELSIPKLLEVGGDVMFWNNTALSKLSLPVLTNVTEDIILHGNTELKSLNLPELSLVEGDIAANGSFTSVLLPGLTSVEGNVYVRSNEPLDCSTLDPYDQGVVFKAQYYCNGTGTPTATASSTGSTGTSAPAEGSKSSGGLSGGAKGGIAAGVILGILALAAGAFFLFRRRKRAASTKPDDEVKDSGNNAPEVPQEGGHEKSTLLGQHDTPSTAELPTSQSQRDLSHPTPVNESRRAELDASAASHITDVSELPGGPYVDRQELEGTKPRSELLGTKASKAWGRHEKP